MITNHEKRQIEASGREISIILSGGGDDIDRILKEISKRGVFSGRSVAYVAIAAETNDKLLSIITEGFDSLKKTIQSYGAIDASLVTSHTYDEMFKHDVIILSGGDTAYLLNALQEGELVNELRRHANIQTLIGISAGAIALARTGIGTMRGRQHEYEGLGLIDLTVVPHSNSALVCQYGDALQLEEYDLYQCSVQIG